MVKIRQQKQVKAFLIRTFGPEQGGALFARQEKALAILLENQQGKSKSQMKTLTRSILPCIALYRALQAAGSPQEEAYRFVKSYMQETVAAKQQASMEKMERVPGFYGLYSTIFLKVVRGSDLWQSTQSRSKDAFDVTIRKCLWHTTCMENGCPELCRLFCDVDNVTYGGRKKIGFARTQTLGRGGDCCDFHFFRK